MDSFGHVQAYTNWSVQVFGTGTYTVIIQGSLDGNNWNSAQSPATITTPGFFLVTFGTTAVAVPYIRANVSSITGGNVSALAVGIS
jgi:hypothetical protein